jgi:hypothetical protein
MFLLSSHHFFDDGVTGINVYKKGIAVIKNIMTPQRRGHKNHFFNNEGGKNLV